MMSYYTYLKTRTTMAYIKKQERDELHRTIWNIADVIVCKGTAENSSIMDVLGLDRVTKIHRVNIGFH